jgi:hypothetical protein
MDKSGPGAGDIFAAAIEAELQQERNRKASLEQRALAIITSSGILVSLLFAFGTAFQRVAEPPLVARTLIGVALAAFVAAVLMSLLANRPVDYRPLGVKNDLERMVNTELWFSTADSARRSISEYRVSEVDTWRNNNKVKAAHLQYAIAAESVGIGLLAASVAVNLI